LDNPLFGKSFVLKPIEGGSTLDALIARTPSPEKLEEAKQLLKKYDKMLLEELIFGIEITVPVLGNKALPVIEIIPPADKEFDYENKYNGASQELCPPQNVSDEIQKRAQELAERIHKLCGCNDMSRTDMIIDESGELFVLETNTIPGLTDQSLFPKAAAEAGHSMSELVDILVKSALKSP
jgi:D-alanine-D-alanine ligase